MQRIWLPLILLVGVFTFKAGTQVLPSAVVTPPSQQIQRDSTGFVRLRVNNIQHLHAYNVEISYDPSIVRCRGARSMGFLGSFTFFASSIDSIQGRVTVNEAILGLTGRSGSGDFAELMFVGLSHGGTTLSFSVSDFRDTTNLPINVSTQGGMIQVGPPSDVEEREDGVPSDVHIESYPNPFNPTTTIRLYQEHAGPAIIRIYSVTGKETFLMVCGDRGAGHHEYVWDGRDRDGIQVASGMYVVRGETATSSATTKVVLLR